MRKKIMSEIDKVYNLIGYWNRDEWDLFNCGLENIEKCVNNKVISYRYINFSKLNNDNIKKEMKYYVFNILLEFKGDYSKLRQNHLYVIKWFMKYLEQDKENIISIIDIEKKFIENYIEFLKINNVNTTYKRIYINSIICTNNVARFPYKIRRFFIDVYNKAYDRELDIWNIKDFNISSHRINLSRDINALRFYDIRNEKNKELLKIYVKHLIFDTEISLSFIYGKVIDIKFFLKFIGNKILMDVDRSDIEKYKEILLNRNIINATYNRRLFSLSNFLNFYLKQGVLNYNHIYIEFDILDTSLKIKANTVEQSVIEQILKLNNKVPKVYLVMFLILYCCGMRISEVCILKVGCLKKDENGYYIVFYQQKMKKEVSNPIPENLYYLILSHQEGIIEEHGKNQIYLFPAKNKMPIKANTYKSKMQRIFNNLNIKNSDGTIYIFRPHEYRHTFATNLIEKDIPFTVIQKLLHHNSPEMSLVYTQLTDSRKRRKYVEFINLIGEKSTTLFGNEEEVEKIYEVQWLKNNLKSQALPNGYCSLPVSLGQCPYANVCLTCEHFKTTKGHLDILKKQLNRTEQLIEVLKERNMIKQLETNVKVKKNLEKLINFVEDGE
ncbi:phage integrase family protein [Clostridium botulinum]|nr:phage integrase family protein [Clostridium botulinum]NFM04082.1 phage integrase family protein [Clostridium botulinum]